MRSLRPFLILTLFLSAVVLPRGFLLAESKHAANEEAQAIATKAAVFLTRVGKGSATGSQWTSASSGGGGGRFSLVGSKGGRPPNWIDVGGGARVYDPQNGKLILRYGYKYVPKGTGQTYMRPKNVTPAHEAYAQGIEHGVYFDNTKASSFDQFPKVHRLPPLVTFADMPGSKSAMVCAVDAERTTSLESNLRFRGRGRDLHREAVPELKSKTSTRVFMVVNTLVDPEKSLMENYEKAKGKTELEMRSMMGLAHYEGVLEYRKKQDIDAALKRRGVIAGRIQMAKVYNSFSDNALLNTWLQAMQTRFGDDADAMHEWLTKNISATAADSPEEGMAESFAYETSYGQLPGFLNVWGKYMLSPRVTPLPPVEEAP